MGKRKMDSDLHRIKLETGTVYQTRKCGNYYFRYQVKGERKCVSLKTANQEEAIRKAKALLPTVQATNLEVIATHVKIARKLAAQTKSLPISQIWETYSTHLQRAARLPCGGGIFFFRSSFTEFPRRHTEMFAECGGKIQLTFESALQCDLFY